MGWKQVSWSAFAFVSVQGPVESLNPLWYRAQQRKNQCYQQPCRGPVP